MKISEGDIVAFQYLLNPDNPRQLGRVVQLHHSNPALKDDVLVQFGPNSRQWIDRTSLTTPTNEERSNYRG